MVGLSYTFAWATHGAVVALVRKREACNPGLSTCPKVAGSYYSFTIALHEERVLCTTLRFTPVASRSKGTNVQAMERSFGVKTSRLAATCGRARYSPKLSAQRAGTMQHRPTGLVHRMRMACAKTKRGCQLALSASSACKLRSRFIAIMVVTCHVSSRDRRMVWNPRDVKRPC